MDAGRYIAIERGAFTFEPPAFHNEPLPCFPLADRLTAEMLAALWRLRESLRPA